MLTKLPPKLQKELSRWYIFSCIALTCTLCALAAAHSYFVWAHKEVTRAAPRMHEQLITPPFEACTAEHEQFFDTFATFVDTVDDTIQLTYLMVNSQEITAHGAASGHETIMHLVERLQEQGFTHIVQLTIEPGSTVPYQFKLIIEKHAHGCTTDSHLTCP